MLPTVYTFHSLILSYLVRASHQENLQIHNEPAEALSYSC